MNLYFGVCREATKKGIHFMTVFRRENKGEEKMGRRDERIPGNIHQPPLSTSLAKKPLSAFRNRLEFH